MMIKTLLIALLVLTTLGGSSVRAVKFQDVLNAVARKAGYSPESGNFLENQAIPVGEYINSWVGRLYPSQDWPEWTKVVKVAPPSSHVVPYRQIAGGPASTVTPYNIWTVFSVYLIDPATVRNPPRTRFTLQENGIHCGYEHGTFVWIKYIEPSPEFTAVVWRAQDTYARDNVVYWPDTGECYKSKANNNTGHDPTGEDTSDRQLTTEITQVQTPNSAGVLEQEQIIRLYFGDVSPDPDPADPPPNLSVFSVSVFDADGNTLSSQSDGGTGSKTISQIMDTLRTLLLADLGAGWTITNNSTNKTMDIQNASKFGVTQAGTLVPSYFAPPPDNNVAHFLKVAQIQPYVPAVTGTTGDDQIIQLSLTDNDVVAGATYTLTFREQSGQEHIATYVALDGDGVPEIIAGLLAAITAEATTDDFFLSVFTSSASPVAEFRTRNPVSLDATITREGSPYWEVVPFPEALENAVVRGATADLLGEWGQTDKQGVEEGKVPAESSQSAQDFSPKPTAPLTTQQLPYSRYKL